ncbi:MAG: DUF6351 family protein, partial [Sciscionella sp.]
PTAAESATASTYELNAMDRWLTAIDADHSRHSLRRKVIADKPSDLGDGCYISATTRIRQHLTDPAKGQCGQLYPVAENTRTAAGEDLNMDVTKCRLRPLNFRDYPVTFTAAERKELRAAFPNGVCDYNRPSIGKRHPIGAWLSYGDEKTGTTPPRKLPNPPRQW